MVSARQLAAHGVLPAERNRFIARGQLRPVRRGWYTGTQADPSILRAVQLGGTLSCVSALERFGVWRPTSAEGLHVRYRRRHLAQSGVRAHVLPREIGEPMTLAWDRPTKAILCALSCLPLHDAVAVLDSARSLNVIDEEGLAEVATWASGDGKKAISLSCGSAESGLETAMRLLLRSLQLRYRCQVVIPGVGRVDFLVGDRLIIEVDGERYHSDSAQFHRDRERDRLLHSMGFVVLRFAFRDLAYGQDSAREVILHAVRADAHMWSRSNCLWRRRGLRDPVVAWS